MKHSKLIGLIISAIPAFLFSQDVMVLKNSDEIKAKVIEINDLTILYKKWENLTGPNYNIKKEEVLFIRYENGTKEVISAVAQAPAVLSNSASPNSIPTTNGNTMNTQSQELAFRGEQDANNYYRGRNSGKGWVFATCVLTTPVVALIPAIACSLTPPSEINMNIPPTEVAQNQLYRDAYKKQAHKIKQRKVMANLGYGTLTFVVLVVLFA
jgi:hypothetical protein